jgi:hypothetical protein
MQYRIGTTEWRSRQEQFCGFLRVTGKITATFRGFFAPTDHFPDECH